MPPTDRYPAHGPGPGEQRDRLRPPDLARDHLQTYLKLAGKAGPLPGADPEEFHEQAAQYQETLDQLARSVTQRQGLAAQRIALVAKLRQAHEKLAEKLGPMADDAAFTLTLGLQSAADKGEIDAVKKRP